MFKIIATWDNSVWGTFWRSLFWPSAESMVSYEIRLHFSGIYLSNSWKSLEMHDLISINSWLSLWDFFFPFIQPEPFLIQPPEILPQSLALHHCEQSGSITISRFLRICCYVSQRRLFSKLNKLSSLIFPSHAKWSALWPSWWLYFSVKVLLNIEYIQSSWML